VDARRAPGWVLGHHPENEITCLFRNPFSADRPARSGDEAPIERCYRTPLVDGNAVSC
jgi:hypothetical protein